MKEPMMADSHEITVRNYKQPMRNRLIMMLICIGIALTSFFVVSKWATSVESYRWVIKTLNGLQKKALGLSGTATALATGAAAIPGEAATPIANKLADVAGYMVIVYAVIIVEKYLLTITGYIAFKILFLFSSLKIIGFNSSSPKASIYSLQGPSHTESREHLKQFFPFLFIDFLISPNSVTASLIVSIELIFHYFIYY